MGQKSSMDADTKPSGDPPQSAPSKNARRAAANSDDPMAGNEPGEVPDEQARLLHTQVKGKGKRVHYEGDSDTSPRPPSAGT
jgi:hypothetical protein